MRILLVSVGTRGDMEPFVAIGEILMAKGHQVICAFPEQFRTIVLESGLEFASLGTNFINILESNDGKAAMGAATGLKKIVGTIRLTLKQNDANKELLFKQKEIVESVQPDRVLHNSKAIFPFMWGLKNRGKTILVSALPYLHYTKGHSHIAFHSNFGRFFNKFTFSLAHFGMFVTVKICLKWLNTNQKIYRKDLLEMLRFGKSIYTVSPSLFARPNYWSENLKVLGYHKSNRVTSWKPDNELIRFIEKHKKILFVTFGSMTNPDPEGKTRILIDILERNKIPAIINTAGGGLAKPKSLKSDHIQFVSQIPYEWIFPKIYAVIHHGGSGTTHQALGYGCATMIIPHIIDQFIWNRIVTQKGAGPKGVRIGKISVKNLEPKIIDLMNNELYKSNAEEIGKQMMNEDYMDELCQIIVE
ncbi:MAG TPA: glycosyltransferase [Tenuifilaceae bacterium]|nr:glycosyltransferase [Tenuifilaceae bacterium]HPE17589.1 glycosyltransferase [Tenuifilaceae bacterium]HPJ45949.1 glycosyltransferase [Tenuifilaceae bacterium]HPQ34293.1 glycosyltransferase [Tenuifilaceae bacterium]HRX67961.1 glycosyltransferase [Tenuifilaceae bacterium]